MRRPRVIAVVLAGLIAGGCAAKGSGSYAKPGATEEQRRQDERECLSASVDSREGQRAGFFVPFDRDQFATCMTARGYALKPAQ